MKKIIATVMTLAMAALMFVGCAQQPAASSAPAETKAPETQAATQAPAETQAAGTEAPAAGMEGEITVISREDGSGTRGAFIKGRCGRLLVCHPRHGETEGGI